MADDGGSHEGGGGGGVREQDRFLPIANISRIMKKAVPANGKIAKDAKETLQECVSEFISFVTSEASDKCQKEKRKTINGDDLLWAMATLGFEEYVDPLKNYLQKYREMEGDSKLSTKGGDGSVKKDAISPHGGTSSSSNQVSICYFWFNMESTTKGWAICNLSTTMEIPKRLKLKIAAVFCGYSSAKSIGSMFIGRKLSHLKGV
ncbi:hypothetical protein EJB05_18664 [Eragrostis curvula]|uniref:Transcription factor CBF/NF-Y/archaeal histone domain-containing protein n=1 Tax=Eragrostis curvula TaxID=38414 RepID=A0A5J9VKE7_9POAL|nr:hypothetical protein EJB05_18664 [Eragrostis curvula]